MPASAPEMQGISSAAILRFLDAAATSTHEFHSLMIARHGHIIAQGWWSPYRADAAHLMYSLTKSFTSTALGFAVTEGRVKVEDGVIKYFPDQLPPIVGDNLAALRIEHLLTMAAGHATETNATITREYDWAGAFLALPIEHAPGSVFLYDSGATYMVGAIVQKVTGQRLFDYLSARLCAPLGIEGSTWEICPRGLNIGGWGLSVTTETLAKFGQFYLQTGQWNGKQLLPREWIERATSFHIQQQPRDPDSEWAQGYGYQFWRCRHHAFRGDGAFGQYCIVMPDQDAVVAITSCTRDMQGIFNMVWDHLLPAMGDKPLAPDPVAHTSLTNRLTALALPPPAGKAHSATAKAISGKRYRLQPNSFGATSVAFDFSSQLCTFHLSTAEVRCGIGKWQYGNTDMPGTPPRIRELSAPVPGASPLLKVAAASAWKDDRTLEMQWRFYETPHYDIVTCNFDGNQVAIEFVNSITRASLQSAQPHPEARPVLLGSFAS